jgi:hypothetical protein
MHALFLNVYLAPKPLAFGMAFLPALPPERLAERLPNAAEGSADAFGAGAPCLLIAILAMFCIMTFMRWKSAMSSCA